MDSRTATDAVSKYGSQSKAAHALGVSKKSVWRAMQKLKGGVPVEHKQAAVSDDNTPSVEVSGATGGFVLNGKKLLAAKPTDVWKARFYSLRRGMGYTIDHLCDEWGASADTVRSKAKRIGSLRYVEDDQRPGEYIACAVHPDTPKGK